MKNNINDEDKIIRKNKKIIEKLQKQNKMLEEAKSERKSKCNKSSYADIKIIQENNEMKELCISGEFIDVIASLTAIIHSIMSSALEDGSISKEKFAKATYTLLHTTADFAINELNNK